MYTAPSASAGTVYTVPSSIASDCSVGVTQKLNTWLASIPSGASATDRNTVDFGTGKCYLLNPIANSATADTDGLRVWQKKNWKITGASTIKTNSTVTTVNGRATNRAQLGIVDGDHIEVSKLTLRGKRASATYNGDLQYDHNATVIGGQWVEFRGVTMDQADGDNLSIKAHNSVAPKVVAASDATFSNAGRFNVSMQAADGVWLTRLKMVNSGHTSVDVELHDASFVMRNINMDSNTHTGMTQGIVHITSRTGAVTGVDGVTIKNSVMTSAPLSPSSYPAVAINYQHLNDVMLTKNVSIIGGTLMGKEYIVDAQSVSNLKVSQVNASSSAQGSAANTSGTYALVAGGGNIVGAALTSNTFTVKKVGAKKAVWAQKKSASPVVKSLAQSGNVVR